LISATVGSRNAVSKVLFQQTEKCLKNHVKQVAVI